MLSLSLSFPDLDPASSHALALFAVCLLGVVIRLASCLCVGCIHECCHLVPGHLGCRGCSVVRGSALVGSLVSEGACMVSATLASLLARTSRLSVGVEAACGELRLSPFQEHSESRSYYPHFGHWNIPTTSKNPTKRENGLVPTNF